MSETSWLDGRDIVLLYHGMEVQARYCEGQWTPQSPIADADAEYDGAVWSCVDDEFQIEIEEVSPFAYEWSHNGVTHWRELTPRPPVPTELPAGYYIIDGLEAPHDADEVDGRYCLYTPEDEPIANLHDYDELLRFAWEHMAYEAVEFTLEENDDAL